MVQMRNKKEQQGITLLIVILIGSIMLLTSVAVGDYALRMVRSIQSRGDAIQALYTAEQTFTCVKYWLNKDTVNFTNQATTQVVCNGYTYNFGTLGYSDTATDGHDPSFAGNTGTFRVPNDPTNPNGGGVLVQIECSAVSQHNFNGTVRLFSQTNEAANSKIAERYQEYDYRVLHGADIMFVVDRSGSIDRGDPSEWDAMLAAVTGSIRALNKKVPMPHVGLLSFGTDASDVGTRNGNVLEPDVPLTDIYLNLINDNGTTYDYTDDVPIMDLSESVTNLSLGISIAGAELMGKSYPFKGLTTTNPTNGDDTGGFERIVANDLNFSLLPTSDSAGMDRPDADYPDVIVLISDGAPNVIMTHVYQPGGLTFYWGVALAFSPINTFFEPEAHNYQVGEAKLFRTEPVGQGKQIVDDGVPRPSTSGPYSVPPGSRYKWCNDAVSEDPGDVLGGALDTDTFPHFAMCNATLIANKLKSDGGIKFVVVYVGINESSDEAIWLRDYVASLDSAGDPLFAQVSNYSEVKEKLVEMFEKLDLVQSI